MPQDVRIVYIGGNPQTFLSERKPLFHIKCYADEPGYIRTVVQLVKLRAEFLGYSERLHTGNYLRLTFPAHFVNLDAEMVFEAPTPDARLTAANFGWLQDYITVEPFVGNAALPA